MEFFPITLYSLCVLTSAACMVLLFRAYAQTKTRLLLWSALCFVGLTINNAVLFLDLVVLPGGDLRAVRLSFALGGMLLLLYGFVWDAE